MAISDFFPFKDGQVVTAAQWNELFQAIKDGSFMLSDTDIGNITARITALEQEVSYFRRFNFKITRRFQVHLSAGMDRVELPFLPLLDSERVYYNSTLLTKKDENFPDGDYYMDGKTIIFTDRFKNEIQDDDILVVIYETEVSHDTI